MCSGDLNHQRTLKPGPRALAEVICVRQWHKSARQERESTSSLGNSQPRLRLRT